MRSAKWCAALLVLMLVVAGCGGETEKPGEGNGDKAKPKDEAAQPKKMERMTLDLGQGVTMELVLIPAGEFMMGSLSTETDHQSDEAPFHKVTLTRPFYIGVTEVTQRQFEAVTGKNPSANKGENHPVDSLSWWEAEKFLEKLSEKTGKTCRFPTEAEWEYACRAGTTTRWSFGDDEKELAYYAWYEGNSADKHHPVGEKKPNPWGLYDMHGNICELVYDRYTPKYDEGPAVDPTGSDVKVAIHVRRGGAFNHEARDLRSARRVAIGSGIVLNTIGLRVVVEK